MLSLSTELAASDDVPSTLVSIQNSLIVSRLVEDGRPDSGPASCPISIAGLAIGAFALTQTQPGSDAAAMRYRAEEVEAG